MRIILDNPWLEIAARWILALTFIYASFTKILEPGEFARIIYGYDLFPEQSINLLAIFVPWLELIAAFSLISGIYPRAGALLITGMLTLYMIVLSINLIRGHEFDCGCFSTDAFFTASTESLLIRDVFYFALGLFIFFFRRSRRWCLSGYGD